MPCDSINTVNVNLASANMSADLLCKALVSLGMTVQTQDGVINAYGNGTTLAYYTANRQCSIRQGRYADGLTEAKIKQAYGAEVVKSQASKYGWTLRAAGPYKWEVIKR